MITSNYIGREDEKAKLQRAASSSKPELIAVVGRRRVGKTFLVNSFFNLKFDFEITAVHADSIQEQIHSFALKLRTYSKIPIPSIANWLDAFEWLKVVLHQKKTKRKKIIFIDELPWFDNPRSGFVNSFAHFWNDWASKQNVVVIISGSSTSWMIKKIVNNKGGLHNRLTDIIYLKPFTLKETKQYLSLHAIRLESYQLTLLYMCLGGIPHYLLEAKKGKSAAQIVGDVFFNSKSTLTNEFHNLYHSLFNNAEDYISLIRIISKKWQGVTRKEIVTALKIKDGGRISEMIQDLLLSDFIIQQKPFGKSKKDSVYRLIDFYSLFYLKFVEKNQFQDFLAVLDSSQWKAWAGYAFENIWFTHVTQLKQALGIAAVRSSNCSFRKAGTRDTDGLQIDLLIDRGDHTINICEAKFYDQPAVLDKAHAWQLRTRINRFKESTKTKKHLFLTLLNLYGLSENQYSIGLVDQVLTIDDLLV